MLKTNIESKFKGYIEDIPFEDEVIYDSIINFYQLYIEEIIDESDLIYDSKFRHNIIKSINNYIEDNINNFVSVEDSIEILILFFTGKKEILLNYLDNNKNSFEEFENDFKNYYTTNSWKLN